MKAALLITLLAFSLTYSSATELNTPTGLALAANGDLWVGSKNSLEKFVAESLKPGSQPQSALSIKAIEQSLNLPGVLRFDGAGNLWAANYFANTLVKYTPSQLEQSGAPVPGITIKSSSLQEPNAFVFDQNGGMWVASSCINALLYFNANQLVQGGTLTPSKTIEATQGSLNSPAGLGFDSIGGLWVSNYSANTLVRYTSAQLEQAGAVTPQITIQAQKSSLAGAGLMAFDATDNLWVSNFDSSTLVQFTPKQLEASGKPMPNVIISGNMVNPNQILPTADGGLWVSSSGSNNVLRYSVEKLKTSGSPTPDLILR